MFDLKALWPQRRAAERYSAPAAPEDEAGWRTVGADELERELYGAVVRKEPVMLVGPPGVGKTYTSKRVGARAKGEKKIKTFEVIVGDKNLTPDALFESRLVITDKSKRFVRLIPSMIRRHVGKSFIPVDEVKSADDARDRWKDEDYLFLVLDEASRCTPSFVDALLPVLNDFQVTVEGRTFYAPVLVTLLLNPPGMDATAAAFSHALTSRLYQRFTIRQPGPRELCDIYTLPHVKKDAERFKIRHTDANLAGMARLACGVITLLWGLPVKGRPGMASLSDNAIHLITQAARLDPKLESLLTRLGPMVRFGPDARKGRRWLITAAHGASRKGAIVAHRHLIETCVPCLSVGGKQTFSEGQEPDKQAEFEKLIHEITSLVLQSKALRDLLLDPPAVIRPPYDPGTLAAGFFSEAVEDRRITMHHSWEVFTERLQEDEVPNRTAVRAEGKRFLESLATQGANIDTWQREGKSEQDAVFQIAKTAHEVSTPAEGWREHKPPISKDGFSTDAYREMFRALAEYADAPGASWMVQALSACLKSPTGADPLLSPAEEARLACRRIGLPDRHVRDIFQLTERHAEFRGRAERIALLLAEVLKLEGKKIGKLPEVTSAQFPTPDDPEKLPVWSSERRELVAWLERLSEAHMDLAERCETAIGYLKG